MTIDRLAELKKKVEEESSQINVFLREIAGVYCVELDALVEEIETVLADIKSGAISEYSEVDLEYLSMKLPTVIYKVGDRLEELGTHSDVAKAKRREQFNGLILQLRSADGTQAEKKARVERAIETEQTVENIYSRAYSQIKNKLEHAEAIYSGVKKILSKRMLELEVFAHDGTGADRQAGGRPEQDDDGFMPYRGGRR